MIFHWVIGEMELYAIISSSQIRTTEWVFKHLFACFLPNWFHMSGALIVIYGAGELVKCHLKYRLFYMVKEKEWLKWLLQAVAKAALLVVLTANSLAAACIQHLPPSLSLHDRWIPGKTPLKVCIYLSINGLWLYEKCRSHADIQETTTKLHILFVNWLPNVVRFTILTWN